MSNMELQRVGAEALVARAAFYTGAAKAANTQRGYAGDVRKFNAWAAKNGMPSMPTSAEVLACYVAALADEGRKVSTIERAVTGVTAAHRAAGLDLPRGRALEETMVGIRRTLGTAKEGKTAIVAEDLRRMVDSCGRDLRGLLDRAVLLVGWVGAFRRSEIAAIKVEDVTVTRHGLEVVLRRSKTDQVGANRTVGLPNSSDADMCPAKALLAWLSASRIGSGLAFPISDEDVNEIVKEAAKRVGLSGVSAHSLRAGFMTEAAEKGRSMKSMMQQSGHTSEKIAMGYIRHAGVWADNAARGLL
jgi:integrase